MELEEMEKPLDDTGIEVDEPPKEYSGRKVLWENVVADKLDSIMVLSFEHLKSCHESGRLVQVFEVLLQSFQSTVLSAYKSKFAQFVVMFYACSLDPEKCGARFVSRLVDIFTNGAFPQDLRMSAVAYLASYLSRAKFLSTSYVATILERFIRPNFIFWSLVRTTDDDDEDEDEGSSDEDEDEGSSDEDDGAHRDDDDATDGGMAISYEDGLDIDNFDLSMNQMSIMPRDSLRYRFGNESQGRQQMPSRIRPSTSPESL